MNQRICETIIKEELETEQSDVDDAVLFGIEIKYEDGTFGTSNTTNGLQNECATVKEEITQEEEKEQHDFHFVDMEVFNEEEENSMHQSPDQPSSSTQKKVKQRKKIPERRCKECNKKFKYESDLKRHMLVHSDEKPYACTDCEKAFKTKRNLDVHKLTHSGVSKKHICYVCQTAFRHKSHLDDHILIHTGERPYACTQCDKKFRVRSVLYKHLRTHSDESSIARPYRCEICDKSFTQKPHLDDHIRIHTAERPYECEYCKKTFVQKSALNSHLKSHKIRKITL